MSSSPDPDHTEGTQEETHEEPLAFRAVRGGLWLTAGSYFNIGFGFVATLVLTRLLAPEHFGIIALATFFFWLINLHVKIGLGFAVARYREITGELVGTLLGTSMLAGTGNLLLSAVAAPILLALNYSPEVIVAMLFLASVSLIDAVTGIPGTLLDVHLHFKQTSLLTSIIFPLSYLPAFYLALNHGGYWSLLAQNATYALLQLIGLWWLARRILPEIWRVRWRFDGALARQLVGFGSVVGAGNFVSFFVSTFDNFLVGTFVNLTTLGFYDRAYRIAEWPNKLVSSVTSRAAFYTYARLQGDPTRLSKTATMTTWLVMVLILPFAIAVFASAPDLVRLLYGETWLPSALFLRFLIVYSVIRPLLDNANSLFIATGHPKRMTFVVTLQAVTLILAATPLTILYGAVGTAVGVGIAFAVGVTVTLVFMLRTVSFPWSNALLVPALAAVATLALYFLFAASVNLNEFSLPVRVVAKSAFAVGVFAALILILQRDLLRERSSYLWRLLRREPGPTSPETI